MPTNPRHQISSPLGKRLITLTQRAFAPLALAFLGYAAYTSRGAIQQILAEANLAILTVTLVAWSMLSLLAPVISLAFLRGMGSNVNYITLLKIYVDRLPARYIPGGIWQTVSRVVDLHRLGVDRGQLSALVILENFASLAVAMIVGGLCAYFSATVQVPAIWVIVTGVVLAAGLPYLARFLFRREPLALTSYFFALSAICLFWMLAATLFAVYWIAFPSLDMTTDLLNLYASYLLAWVAGFIAIFAPQGIGVFEVVSGLLLQSDLPLVGITILVAGFRVLMLAGDLLAYLVAWILRWAVGGRQRMSAGE